MCFAVWLAIATATSACIGASSVRIVLDDGARRPSQRERLCEATRVDWRAQIRADLLPFRDTGITRARLDAAVRCLNASTESGFLVSLRGGRLFAREIRGRRRARAPSAAFLFLFQKALACFPAAAPDVDLVVHDGDAPLSGASCARGLPLVGYVKEPARHDDILMPCPWQFNNHWARWQFRRAPLPAWAARDARAIFRGAPTGGTYAAASWRARARARLVLACRAIPSLCDAGFHTWRCRG